MFIESLDIRDFRGISAATAELAPFTVIRGTNHAGKTSVKQALQLQMTSRSKGVDGQGRGFKDKIRHGTKKCHINSVLRSKSGSMPFGVTYGPGATGRQIVTANPKSFLEWLDRNADRLSCAFDGDHFIAQKADEQKNILASLVLPTEFDFPEVYREQVKTLLGEYKNWDAPPAQVIEEIHGLAYDARRIANVTSSGILIPQLPPKPGHTVEQINKKLAELREKQRSIAAPAKTGAAELGKLELQLDRETAKLKEAETVAATMRSALTDVESDILDPLDLKQYGRLAAHRSERALLEQQVQEAGTKIEEQRQVQMVYRDLLEEKSCPTCHQPIGEAFINARIREAGETIVALGDTQRELMRKQKELGDIAGAEKLVLAHKNAEENKRSLQAELGDAVASISSLQLSVRQLTQQVEERKAATEIPAPNPELDNVLAQIERVEAELSPAIHYEHTVETIDKSVARKRELETRIAGLERLVTYFGKDGIKATLIKENFDNFKATVNSVLHSWGYTAALSIEPYTFEVTLPGGATIPLKELSGSEEMMFAIALQAAIAHYAGIKIVVIDKADTFIDSERNRLMFCIEKLILKGVLDQAIVLVSDSRIEAPKKEGVAYFAAQNGTLVRL